MENTIYQDPIMKKYGQMIEAAKLFKEIYYGEPIRIPNSSLPALVIAKVDTRVGKFTNSEDIHELRLSFTAVTDVRDTISEDKEMVKGVNTLYNLMEGREETTYQLKKNTLLYLLRHNADIDTANDLRTDLQSMSRIDYGMTMGKRKDGAWSIEGTLEITATFTQTR